MNSIDRHLEQVKDRQFAFKNPVLRSVSCRIVEAALAKRRFWPDDVSHNEIARSDKNTIGSAFRLLMNAGLIRRSTTFRRSHAEGAKGRTIFGYELTNVPLAETFLRKNSETSVTSIGQLTLF